MASGSDKYESVKDSAVIFDNPVVKHTGGSVVVRRRHDAVNEHISGEPVAYVGPKMTVAVATSIKTPSKLKSIVATYRKCLGWNGLNIRIRIYK